MNRSNYKNYPITFGIIGACTIIYIYTSITYSFDMNALQGYEAGGYMPLAILLDKEYYRLITANFIHFGFTHILMNMISLYNIGPFMESVFGKLRYILLIVGSCLGTTFLPYLHYRIFLDPYSEVALTISGGASGIILGLLGGLCCLAVFYRGLFKQAFRSILPSLLLIVLISLTVPTISLSGHLGGFIGGFITTFILIRLKPYYLWKYHPKKNEDMTNRPC